MPRSFLTIHRIAALAGVLLACAGPGVIKRPSPVITQMAQADALFAAGKFDTAKTMYEKIRNAMPPTSAEAQKAHYYIGYIDVFHKNPWADWSSALAEFKSFAALYPDDPHINEVLSWIRILTTIKSFETEYRKTSHQVEHLSADKSAIHETQLFHLDSMAAILRSSYESRDSLARIGDSLTRKNTELINTMIYLEKKCQRAGK